MRPLTNTAFFHAKPGQGETLGARLLELVEPSRKEPGCIRYDIFQSQDKPDTWFVYEDWRSPEDLEVHMRTPYVRAFLKDVAALVEGDVEIHAYQMKSAPAAVR